MLNHNLATCKHKFVCVVNILLIVLGTFTGDDVAGAPSSNSKFSFRNIKSLDVYVHKDKIHVLLADEIPDQKETHLVYLSSTDVGRNWSSPARIDRGMKPPYARRRGADFQIAATGDRIVAVWMAGGSGFMGRGPLVSAYSSDSGRTWNPSATPADDGSNGDHAFIDIAADPEGKFHVVWLDKRNGREKGLYSATSIDNGRSWLKNQIIDNKTCECCWNVIQSDAHGNLYSLYRDINPRDMAVAVSEDHGVAWQKKGPVGAFAWDFAGCPHSGGGLAITHINAQDKLHAIVWTGMQNVTGIYYLQALAHEFNWTDPMVIANKGSKHPDIASNSKGHLAIAWDEFNHNESAIFTSKSIDNGKTWSKPRRLSLPGYDATHARITSVSNHFIVFWTETKDHVAMWNHSSF